MDPYAIVGVPRGCTREQLKDAFRAQVLRVHPDRGGDQATFVRLCNAYRDILNELEQEPIALQDVEALVFDMIRVAPPKPTINTLDPHYVAWVGRIGEEALRRRTQPWWRKNPAMARACLLGLLGLCGVLALAAAIVLATRSAPPLPTSARRPASRPSGPTPTPNARAAALP